MKMYDGGIVEVPICSILFDDPKEFADFEKLAKYDDLGVDWAISILRIYLQCLSLIHISSMLQRLYAER